MLTRLTIAGMSCVHCRRAVFTALAGVPGVTRADVRMGSADVEHDGSAIESALRQAVAIAGYELTGVVEDRRTLPQLR
ncbi:MAG TPA: heavy-metal-associated domain-containing protein [Gemmatimonadaceae bacterium]|nr:heavy-metal-associated domain-containing protein [Gemmatimonadaceae bacterium]